MKHMTRKEVRAAIKMRESGMKIPDILRALHVSNGTLYTYIHHYELTNRWKSAKAGIMREAALKRHGQKPIPLGPLVTLYERGKTYQEIADFFGCSTRKVFLAIRKYGLQPDIKTHEQDMFTVSKYDR